MSLLTQVDAIMTWASDLISGAQAAGQSLEDVRTFWLYDRGPGQPKYPLLALERKSILPSPMTTNRSEAVLQLVFTVQEQNHNHQDGRATTDTLAIALAELLQQDTSLPEALARVEVASLDLSVDAGKGESVATVDFRLHFQYQHI